MAKSKKNKKEFSVLNTHDITARITESLNKKGKIKAKGKKETAILKGACNHHKLNGKGKPRQQIYVQNRVAHCKMCNASFRTDLYTSEEVHKIVDQFKELNNQAKFMIKAIDGGRELEQFFSSMGANLNLYPKFYKNTAKIVDKIDNNKKKKHKKNHGGSSEYGSWA